ncbi:hypothetical protein [Catenulispora pinisilvae]|uniref:hypothetical protein n=1 Tax=Catenulispora pinisilvae TaxID=2705253 RepID=UPI001891C58D|nr:hypothetical protein [Catenulispora pinisilvae]
MRSPAEAIIACDFVVVDLLDRSKAHVPAVNEHATRRVRVLGATFHPTFDALFTTAGIDVIRTGVRAPRQKAIMERWFRSRTTGAVLAMLNAARLDEESVVAQRWRAQHYDRRAREGAASPQAMLAARSPGTATPAPAHGLGTALGSAHEQR